MYRYFHTVSWKYMCLNQCCCHHDKITKLNYFWTCAAIFSFLCHGYYVLESLHHGNINWQIRNWATVLQTLHINLATFVLATLVWICFPVDHTFMGHPVHLSLITLIRRFSNQEIKRSKNGYELNAKWNLGKSSQIKREILVWNCCCMTLIWNWWSVVTKM